MADKITNNDEYNLTIEKNNDQ